MSKAVEVMMQHVENLKHLYEKEHSELEETKKILQESKLQPQEGQFIGWNAHLGHPKKVLVSCFLPHDFFGYSVGRKGTFLLGDYHY